VWGKPAEFIMATCVLCWFFFVVLLLSLFVCCSLFLLTSSFFSQKNLFSHSDMKLLIKKRARRSKRRVCCCHRDSGDRRDTCNICSSSWLPGRGAYWPILSWMVCCHDFTPHFWRTCWLIEQIATQKNVRWSTESTTKSTATACPIKLFPAFGKYGTSFDFWLKALSLASFFQEIVETIVETINKNFPTHSL
jgi:hypothetical protein